MGVSKKELRHLKALTKDALVLLQTIIQEYPGLIDNKTEVNGSDLIESLTYHLDDLYELKEYLQKKLKLKGENNGCM